MIGYDVADALFPSESPIDKSVLINGQNFQGDRRKRATRNLSRPVQLGLDGRDAAAERSKNISVKSAKSATRRRATESDVRVKVKDKTKLAEAKDELTGIMRRVRGLSPEKKDDFSINEQQAFKSTLDPVKNQSRSPASSSPACPCSSARSGS